MRARRLARGWYARDALQVGPHLLNKLLVVGARAGRIVEVEAYRGADDPASHGHRGITPRTTVMFGPAGHLYVYRSYGMHWCANIVCGADGECMAVLLRAIRPEQGEAAMAAARGQVRRAVDIGNGPGKLCAALGIGPEHNGVDLTRAGAPVTVVDDGSAPPADPAVRTRIGLSRATERPWRWYVPDDPHVSRR